MPFSIVPVVASLCVALLCTTRHISQTAAGLLFGFWVNGISEKIDNRCH